MFSQVNAGAGGLAGFEPAASSCLAADGIWGPAEVPIDRSGPRSRIINSAVTVKVARRSPSRPYTAGASGSGLAPPPGAARSIRSAWAASRGVPPPWTAADHQGLVERSQEEARIWTHEAGSSARSEPACSAIVSPMGPSRAPELKCFTCPAVGQARPSRDTLPAACPTTSRSTLEPAYRRPAHSPQWAGRRGVGRSWSDLVDDRWQDLRGRLEAAANEIEEIELPMERRPTP